MRRACLAVALLLASVSVAQESKPEAPASKGPRIAVEPASFDFGKALPNRTLEKEFYIRNWGSADLTIEGVSTTCGCTVVDGWAKLVHPGGNTPLRVRLETRSYSGRVVRKVLVRSNDPAKSLLEVQIEATVVADKAEK